MNRRDEILTDMHRALRARRRRTLGARAVAGTVPVFALAAAWVLMHHAAHSTAPTTPGAPPHAYRHLHVALIEPTGRVETISDDELIDLLERAGRNAGYVRTPDRFVLTGDVTPANGVPPDAATLHP